ncbi:conserved hypothetical protein [gamma proteobacterium HTCC5015]|nr:conserved hypothetical protein [gamma proteobacterium HTCC5015]
MKQWTSALAMLCLGVLVGCQSNTQRSETPSIAEQAKKAPLTILQNYKWVVEDIEEQGIIDKSRVTLVFSEDGRVGGRASCNRLTGSYTAEKNQLSFSQTATTRMMCPEAIMNQEQRFLAALEKVERFDISEHGALMFYAGDAVLIEAFPDESP